MASEVSFGKTLTLQQAAAVIVANPDIRFMVRGEPGIGKSSMLKMIGQMTGYDTAYVDVPNMDLGDIAMPVVNREGRTTEYYPNSRFKLHHGKPVVIMLDEFTKGADPVKNMLHPLLEKTNPRLGDLPIPKGAIVFLTGNLTTDGVGDVLKSHSRNRIVEIHVRKSNWEEWTAWALDNGVAPELLAWLRYHPHALASYLDGGQQDNEFCYNPKRPQAAFVSLRSLETASTLINNRALIDSETLKAALAGAVGEAAAVSMQTYIEFAEQLPTWEATISNPKTAPVPTSAGACAIVAYGAISRVDKQTMTPFMEYLQRFEPEWQAVFCVNVAKNPAKQGVAFSCKAFADWVAKNQDIL